MKKHKLWMLPDGVNELAPQLAYPLEQLRRKILDLFASWGYDLIYPPLVEFLDSLLIGSGTDLDLQTFKLTDQISGKTMGLRADMTPQAVRMDSHVSKKDEPERLCYSGQVARAKVNGVGISRTPHQIGAELFGFKGVEADVEIARLMLATLQAADIGPVTLDIAHVGVFRALIADMNLKKAQKKRLLDILIRKAGHELELLKISSKQRKMLRMLGDFYGGREMLTIARRKLDVPAVSQALDALEMLADQIEESCPGQRINFDLAELRGYKYHNGLLFAAYSERKGTSVATGGRYDEIGKAFGRSRPATGFSADLIELLHLSGRKWHKKAIFAPAVKDAKLAQMITDLRQSGEVVIQQLPKQQGGPEEMDCDRVLHKLADKWQVKNF